VRWKGGQPNKVWTSRVIKAPVDKVWAIMRDFRGHGRLARRHHQDAHAEEGAPDKVSGVRDFYFGDGHLNEELLAPLRHHPQLQLPHHQCEIPWINYVSGPRLWPVTVDNSTFGVWTGDWQASPQDDLVLMPRTEQNVYQRAFMELEKNFFGGKSRRR
jgi:hypothetical protein